MEFATISSTSNCRKGTMPCRYSRPTPIPTKTMASVSRALVCSKICPNHPIKTAYANICASLSLLTMDATTEGGLIKDNKMIDAVSNTPSQNHSLGICSRALAENTAMTLMPVPVYSVPVCALRESVSCLSLLFPFPPVLVARTRLISSDVVGA